MCVFRMHGTIDPTACFRVAEFSAPKRLNGRTHNNVAAIVAHPLKTRKPERLVLAIVETQ
jgi:hypothetical protein